MPVPVISPTQSEVLAAVRDFLLGLVPAGFEVILAQVNVVPEPIAGDFLVMQQPNYSRISTNLDTPNDVRFTGSIAGTVLTVTDVSIGVITAGRLLFGEDVIPGTYIVSGSGTSWVVSASQALSSRIFASGAKSIETDATASIQLDIHGPSAGNNAQIIASLFRDPFATEFFATRLPALSPLYADDPKQVPFINEQQQWEDRWVVDAMLEVNQVLLVPQQYADSVEVEVVSVDAAYPPT